MDKAILFKSTVLAQGTVDHAPDSSIEDGKIDGSGIVCLVEHGDDLVAGLELGDARSDSFDGAGTVGTGDNVVICWEWVFALHDCSAREVARWSGQEERSCTLGIMRSR